MKSELNPGTEGRATPQSQARRLRDVACRVTGAAHAS